MAGSLHTNAPRTGRSRALLTAAGLLLAGLSACIGPGPSLGGGADSGSLNALRSQPLSWEKLEGLERWIETNAARADDRELLDARLELADGRAAFARSDRGTTSGAVLAMREQRARGDYQLVLSDSSASPSQRARAEEGLALLGRTSARPRPAAARPQPRSPGTGLSIVARSQWGAAPENPTHMTPHTAPWDRITVHHTAMPLGGDRSLAGRMAEIRVIQRSHLNKPEGWGDVGYHYLIDPEGRIYEGRRLTWRGAHVAGRNDHNLGVVLLGNFQHDQPSPEALASLERLLEDLRARNGIARSMVRSHGDAAEKGTECPGRNLERWVDRYRGGGGFVSSSPAPRVAVPRASGSPGAVL